MKKRGLKIIGYFFSVMLLLTILSRIVNGALIPKVKIQKVGEQVITHKVSSEGVVTYKKQVSIATRSDLLVDTVEVTEGQNVEVDQLLYVINNSKLKQRIETLQREVEKMELQQIQASDEKSTETQKQQRSIERAQEAYNEAITYGDQQIARAASDLEVAKNKLAVVDRSKENVEEEIKQLEDTINDKQRVYEEAVSTKDKSVNDARRLMEQEADPTADSTVVDQTQKDIEEKQAELDDLRHLAQVNGEVKSTVTGVVTTIAVKAGELTTGGAVLLIADVTVGLRLNLQFSKDDQKYIIVGTDMSLSKAVATDKKNTEKIPDQKVISVTEDEEDPLLLNVVVDLPSEHIKIGETLHGEINVSSTKHEHCIPAEALHLGDGGSYYVYSVNTKNTVMGSEKTIKKIEVEVVDRNNQYVAITGINSEQEVVTETDKEIDEGTKVRVDE